MSSIRQYQRRALESLKPEENSSLLISLENKYYLNKKRIFLLGTSKGVGTCSDLHDVNIAVFGKSPPLCSQIEKIEKNTICEWAVLTRIPTEKEKKDWQHTQKNNCCLVAEGLMVIKEEKNKRANSVHFALTGKKKLYANII